MGSPDQNPLLQAFQDTGEFGTFQIAVFMLTMLASLLSAPVYVDTYLLTYPVQHRCLVPQCDGEDYDADHTNFTIPWTDGNMASCSRRSYSGPTNSSFLNGGSSSSADTDTSANETCSRNTFNEATEACADGWVYDTSLFTSTAVKDFDLVCGRASLALLVSSINMVGIMIGAILAGHLGDRWGRKVGLLVSVALLGAGGSLSAVSPNLLVFLAARVLAGAGGGGVFLTAFVLAAECVGSGYRSYCGVILMIPFACGEALTGLLAYFIRNWRHLQLAVTTPAFVMITYMWLLPESVRWLVLQKRNTAALAVIKQAAKTNKISLNNSLLVDQREDGSGAGPIEPPSKKSILDLMRAPRMRKRTLNLFFCWAVCTLVYYGLSSNSGRMAGNVFVNFIATMLVEIPSYLFTCLVLDRVGRKATLCSVMIIGGLASLTCGLLPQDMTWLIISLSLAGKFGVSAAFAVIFVYSAEIFPTEYRGVGVGGCSMCARVGGILAPFVAGLGMYYPPLPLLVFGTLSIISGCLVILLPETMGCELPQTLQESEDFASDQSLCYFSCCTLPTSVDSDRGSNVDEISVNDEEKEEVEKY